MKEKILVALKSFEKVAAEITDETNKARQELESWIDNPEINNVGCIDSKTKKGSKNPPGGVVFLKSEGYLERFVSSRAEARVTEGILMAHENCLYMRVILNADTLSSQQKIISQTENALKKLNYQYHTNFQIFKEKQGSATPYMKRG